jgi:hypothetical protein
MSSWYSLVEYPRDRELNVADYVDYCILLTGFIALGFWMLRGRERHVFEADQQKVE